MKALYSFLILCSCAFSLMGFDKDNTCIGASYGYIGPMDITIRNMPLEIRSVPIHPDDDYALPKDWAPIDSLIYDSYGTITIGAMCYKKKSRFVFAFGLDLMYALSEDKKRNYTNYPGTETRGYGAALTYASFQKHGPIPMTDIPVLDFFLSISPKISSTVYITENEALSVGGALSYFNLEGEGGWDRYNDNDPEISRTLCRCLPVSLYLQLNLPELAALPFVMTIGGCYPIKVSETEIGKTADIKFRPTFFINFEGCEFGKSD